MAQTLATNDYVYVNNGLPRWQRCDLLIKDSTVTLPTNVPVGSVAYTADLSYMAIFDGTNWTQIGGSN